MIEIKIKYSDILMIEKACNYYGNLGRDVFENDHAFKFRMSLLDHLIHKRIKRLVDNPPLNQIGKKPKKKKLKLEYFEASFLSSIFDYYTKSNLSMEYEKNFTRNLLAMIDLEQKNTINQFSNNLT